MVQDVLEDASRSEGSLQVGIHLPQWGDGATRSAVVDVAQAAEECGFDSVWVADHVVFPVNSETKYPYRDEGTPFTADDGFLEPFTTLSVVAGATTRVRLGTSVLVLPMRHPLLVAKIAASLDVLSDGRVDLAVGAGWWKEEFDALDQKFEARGRRMDEQIDILRDAWSSSTVTRDGESYSFREVACLPHPVQTGGPRILIGGLGKVALRRVAERGDGWHVVGSDIGSLKTMRETLDEIDSGKTLSTSTGMPRDLQRAGERLVGMKEAGVSLAVLNGPENPKELIARLEGYRDEVLPYLGSRAFQL